MTPLQLTPMDSLHATARRVNGIGSQTVCWQVVYTSLKNQLTKVMIHVSYKIDLLQTAIATNIIDAHGQSAGNLCTSLATESVNRGIDPC